MPIYNGQGQAKVRFRSPVTGTQSQVSQVSTLLTSLYGAWNGDSDGTGLTASIYGAWNADSVGSSSLKTSLYAVYNGESNANDSFGSNNGTAVGGLTYTTGKIGNAFNFNGTNAYVSLPNNSFNPTGDFTISAWVNFADNTGYNVIYSSYSSGGTWGNGVDFFREGATNNWSFVLRNVSNVVLFRTPGIGGPTNTWSHMVVVRVVGQDPKFYMNGSLITGTFYTFGNSSINPSYGANQICNIGSQNNGSLLGNFKQDGTSLWNRALSQSEITELYNSGNGAQYITDNFYKPTPNDSVSTNNGTLMNGCTFTTGKVGNYAYLFDGVNDYLSLGTGAFNFGSNSFSISFWFYPSVGNVLQMLVAKGFTGANDKGFYINIDNRYNSNQNGIQFGVSGGTNYQAIATTTASPYIVGAWNHVIAVWDAVSKSIKIYLNGSLATTSTSQSAGSGAAGISDVSNSTATAMLGQYGSGGLYFNGRMDAINSWTRVLTVDEVTQLYNSGTGTQYPFTGTFSSASNQLGMDNGTLMNGCYLSDGKIGKAFTFDGVNDYVSLPDNSFNFTGDFSVSAWIYVSNLSGEKFIISNVNGNASGLNFGWCFGLYDNKLSFGSYGNTVYSAWIGVDTLIVNTWYHVLVTKKSSQKPKFYINGNLSTCSLHPNCTGTDSTNPIYSSATYPNIKSSIGTYIYNNGSSTYAYWNGKIDVLNVYQKELTQSEITELYNSGTGKQLTATSIVKSGLVLNLDASRTSSYPNSGTTWYDISGNGNNGTLANGPVFGTASGGQITFDGVNDNFFRPSINVGTTFTVQTWVKISRFGGGNPWTRAGIIANGYSWSSNQGFTIEATSQNNQNNFLATPGKECFFFSMGSDQYVATSAYGTLTNYVNNWVNISVVVNNTNPIKLYINGIETTYMGQGNGPSSGSMTYPGTLYVGARVDSNEYMQGSVGDVKMYNRSLSDSEILQNFNATKSRFGY